MKENVSNIEKALKLAAKIDEIGPGEDELAQLVQLKGKFLPDQELSADDLDLVTAAQASPEYKKFLEYILKKDQK